VWNSHLACTKLSPKHRFIVINANDKFVQHFDAGDAWYKDKLQKVKIPVEYGLNLVEVDKENLTAVFENVKTGQRETRPFSNLYSLAPTRPNSALMESGLSSNKSNGMLDVDQGTLQHKRYKNVFGLGDVNNLPTTKSFWGGFYQLHVVRNNVVRALHGQSLNAVYSGYTKNVVHLSQNRLTYLIHEYDQRASSANLLDSNGGIIAMLRYYFWAKFHRKRFMSFQLGKSSGPPYGKLGRPNFRKPAGEPSDSKISKFFAKNKAKSPVESH
jgi:NADH dehydrogenase FAD-containing subunit